MESIGYGVEDKNKEDRCTQLQEKVRITTPFVQLLQLSRCLVIRLCEGMQGYKFS